MQRALFLAAKGRNFVLPNPMVGAVIVRDGRIIGEGWHERFGGDHAEVAALKNAAENVEGATIYVTLEPCSHQGKTPPCCEALVQAKIKKVVAAMEDPNPAVAGRGLQMLKNAGVEVVCGVKAGEAKSLNQAFIKFIKTERPYVVLKAAQTLDGRIADANGASKWITGPDARTWVHALRSESNAVLIGSGTAIADNPSLTVRRVEGRQPLRVVLDRRLRIAENASLLTDGAQDQTIIFFSIAEENEKKRERIAKAGCRLIALPEGGAEEHLKFVLQKLGSLGVAQVLVEGGTEIFSAFLQYDLADKIAVFIAPKIFGKGGPAFSIPGFTAEAPLKFSNYAWRQISDDLLFESELKEY